ncbi:MAG: hypothetical protein VCC99_02020 [Alphaproteobacteria bacterium]
MKQQIRQEKVTASFTEAKAIGFHFRGAHYHLSIIRDVVTNDILGKPPKLAADKLRWHLAGFYWELVATFDCTLQVVAAAYELRLARNKVRWDANFRESLSTMKVANPLIDRIGEVISSDWYQDALARRNAITHWDPAFVQALVADGRVVSVRMLNQEDLVPACERLLSNMREFFEYAEATLPAGRIQFL